MSPDEVQPMICWSGRYATGEPVIVTCWKLTAADLENLQKTGRLWLHIQGMSSPPIRVSCHNPFEPPPPGAAAPTQMEERTAPVLGTQGRTRVGWADHAKAWENYAKQYGRRQSAERIAERGGFSRDELDEFAPGWEESKVDR